MPDKKRFLRSRKYKSRGDAIDTSEMPKVMKQIRGQLVPVTICPPMGAPAEQVVGQNAQHLEALGSSGLMGANSGSYRVACIRTEGFND